MASHYLFWRFVSEKVCYDLLISCSAHEKTSLEECGVNMLLVPTAPSGYGA